MSESQFNQNISDILDDQVDSSHILLNRIESWLNSTDFVLGLAKHVYESQQNLAQRLAKQRTYVNDATEFKGLSVQGESAATKPPSIATAFLSLAENSEKMYIGSSKAVELIKGDVIPTLKQHADKLNELGKSVAHESNKINKEIDRQRESTSKQIEQYERSLTTVSQRSKPDPKLDPYVLHCKVRSVAALQLNYENTAAENNLSLQSQVKNIEQQTIEVLQRAISSLNHIQQEVFTTLSSASNEVNSQFQHVSSHDEWLHFQQDNAKKLTPSEGFKRDPTKVTFRNSSHDYSVPLMEGALNRKGTVFKGNTKSGYFVLTQAGFLHQFKSSDYVEDPTPVLSLYIPESELGGIQQKGSGDLTFKIASRDYKKAISSRHRYTFTASSYDELVAWFNALSRVAGATGNVDDTTSDGASLPNSPKVGNDSLPGSSSGFYQNQISTRTESSPDGLTGIPAAVPTDGYIPELKSAGASIPNGASGASTNFGQSVVSRSVANPNVAVLTPSEPVYNGGTSLGGTTLGGANSTLSDGAFTGVSVNGNGRYTSADPSVSNNYGTPHIVGNGNSTLSQTSKTTTHPSKVARDASFSFSDNTKEATYGAGSETSANDRTYNVSNIAYGTAAGVVGVAGLSSEVGDDKLNDLKSKFNSNYVPEYGNSTTKYEDDSDRVNVPKESTYPVYENDKHGTSASVNSYKEVATTKSFSDTNDYDMSRNSKSVTNGSTSNATDQTAGVVYKNTTVKPGSTPSSMTTSISQRNYESNLQSNFVQKSPSSNYSTTVNPGTLSHSRVSGLVNSSSTRSSFVPHYQIPSERTISPSKINTLQSDHVDGLGVGGSFGGVPVDAPSEKDALQSVQREALNNRIDNQGRYLSHPSAKPAHEGYRHDPADGFHTVKNGEQPNPQISQPYDVHTFGASPSPNQKTSNISLPKQSTIPAKSLQSGIQTVDYNKPKTEISDVSTKAYTATYEEASYIDIDSQYSNAKPAFSDNLISNYSKANAERPFLEHGSASTYEQPSFADRIQPKDIEYSDVKASEVPNIASGTKNPLLGSTTTYEQPSFADKIQPKDIEYSDVKASEVPNIASGTKNPLLGSTTTYEQPSFVDKIQPKDIEYSSPREGEVPNIVSSSARSNTNSHPRDNVAPSAVYNVHEHVTRSPRSDFTGGYHSIVGTSDVGSKQTVHRHTSSFENVSRDTSSPLDPLSKRYQGPIDSAFPLSGSSYTTSPSVPSSTLHHKPATLDPKYQGGRGFVDVASVSTNLPGSPRQEVNTLRSNMLAEAKQQQQHRLHHTGTLNNSVFGHGGGKYSSKDYTTSHLFDHNSYGNAGGDL